MIITHIHAPGGDISQPVSGCVGPTTSNDVAASKKTKDRHAVFQDPAQCPKDLFSPPLDTGAYLRPLKQPIFDSEWFVPHKGIKLLPFFKNPGWDSRYEYVDEKKNQHDTNLYLSGMLDYPRQHSVLGFRARFESGTLQKDRDALLGSGALFEFGFGKKQPYLTVPFECVCVGNRTESPSSILAIKTSGKTKETEQSDRQKVIDMAAALIEKCYDNTMYKFNVGSSAIKLKPNELFEAKLSWKKTPLVSRPVLIIMEIIGLMWMPL